MGKKSATTDTPLDLLLEQLAEARRYNPHDTAAPLCLLWPDADKQWVPLLPALRRRVPELLTLGTFQEADRQGPGIWLRTIVGRTIALPGFTPEAIPILYLPGVSRADMRAGDQCPKHVQPLVDLQYLGAVWHQKNGRDWTIEAFLVSKEGAQLEVRTDQATRQSLLAGVDAVFQTPLARLRGHQVDAEAIERLLVDDPCHDLLRWIEEPEVASAGWDPGRKHAFIGMCMQKYSFNPETESPRAAAEKLGLREGPWHEVWRRFKQAPAAYPKIEARLREGKPKGTLLFDREPWPDENDAAETALRLALRELASKPAAEGMAQIKSLHREHAKRLEWPWASLGQAPLASALVCLYEMVEAMPKATLADTLVGAAAAYAATGWQVDRAAVAALAAVESTADREVMSGVLHIVYGDWLDRQARTFQQLTAKKKRAEGVGESSPEYGSSPELLLFVDALRMDLGMSLFERLKDRGYVVTLEHALAGFPSVTATCKPIVTGLPAVFHGKQLLPDFLPQMAEGGQQATTDRLRRAIKDAGHQIVTERTEPPATADAKGWMEYGDIDHQGHQLGADLVYQLRREVDRVADLVADLQRSGWKRIQIVTDHGWLLVPGTMPKVELPSYLTETKWSRCALPTKHAQVQLPVFGWSWNQSQEWVCPPGIGAFVAGQEYAHGGVSPQECVVPRLVVTSDTAGSALQGAPTLEPVSWSGLRCKTAVVNVPAGAKFDLRTRHSEPDSSVLGGAKPVPGTGKISFLVTDEKKMGEAATLVILDEVGKVVARQTTIIGDVA
jgi:hypothetical protein